MSEIERALRRGFGEAATAASARVAPGAAEEGLLEVSYAEVASPLGPLLVAATPRGLVRVAYPDEGTDAVLVELADRLSPRMLEAPGAVDEIRRELEEYFEGRRRRFEVPVDLELARGFSRRVLRAAARIPYGRVSTYRQVASRAGSPRGSRAAGNALGRNPVPVVVPCHRVVHSGGGLGGYTGGLDRKRFLLRLEGAPAGV